MLKFLLAVIVLVGIGAVDAQASELCHVAKSTKLARDQRDDVRMNCLKQKKNQISVAQCLSVAANMEYSINAEDARLVCLYNLRQKPTLKECHGITKLMEFPDSGDEARWECLRRFNRQISKKQCHQLAKNMSYPANEHRAVIYCDQELE